MGKWRGGALHDTQHSICQGARTHSEIESLRIWGASRPGPWSQICITHLGFLYLDLWTLSKGVWVSPRSGRTCWPSGFPGDCPAMNVGDDDVVDDIWCLSVPGERAGPPDPHAPRSRRSLGSCPVGAPVWHGQVARRCSPRHSTFYRSRYKNPF